ncbi:MAG: LapA family protein [Desulfobacteraceae bacterium]
MKKIRLLLVLTLTLALMLLVVQNTAPVSVRFLWFRGEVPAILLLFLTTAGGLILGLLIALLARSHRQSKP